MFHKIKINLTQDEILLISNIPRIENYTSPSGNLKFLEFIDPENIKKIFERKIQFNILPDKIRMAEIKYPGVPAHIDQRGCALNYYINSCDATTIFYKTDIHYKDLHQFDQKEIKNLIPIKTLKVVDGDCFVINTKLIHSVRIDKIGATRLILTFSWPDYDYEEILKNIIVLY